MSYYKKKYSLFKIYLKMQMSIANANISLPIYPALKNSEIDFICKKIIKLKRMKNKKYF
jgi:dTDP-4-amino-4,6-dideoxygalactose transaminase